MPAYAYTGLRKGGKQVKGIESADNVGALKALLKRKGIFLTSVNETAKKAAGAVKTSESGATVRRITAIFTLRKERTRMAIVMTTSTGR